MLDTDTIYTTARKRYVAEMGAHFDNAKFEEAIVRYLDDIKLRYSGAKFAKNFQKICPLGNAVLEDYNIKIIELPNDGFALSSLRFISLNPDEPFIMIEFSTSELDDKNILPILELTKKHYTHLNLDRYSFFSKKDISNSHNHLTITKDKIWVKGPISKERIFKFDHENIEVIPIHSLTDVQYNIYKDEFNGYIYDNPHLKAELRLEKQDYLARLASCGFLFEVLISGEYAGVLAVDKGFEYSCYGLKIAEEFLLKKYRGNGYGKIIQSKLIDQLAILGWTDSYLYGTISSKNIPSLKTARANLRKPFLYSYFASFNK